MYMSDTMILLPSNNSTPPKPSGDATGRRLIRIALPGEAF